MLLGLVACGQPEQGGGKGVIDSSPVKMLSFKAISSWRYDDDLVGMPESVKALSGLRVQMTGRLLAIDDLESRELLLSENREWAGCGGPAFHETVKLVFAKPVDLNAHLDGVTVVGTFLVNPTFVDGYCVELFRLEVESMESLK